jgi:glycerol-3-phosphate acyltransferase PlsY
MAIVFNSLLIVIAYLLGSISSATLISKKYFDIDIRDYGSKNAGATNVLRVLGWKASLPVFLIDFAKGVAAVCLVFVSTLVTDFVPPDRTNPFVGFQIALGAAAVLGHIFPVFSHFKGGKGVATMAGVVLAIFPVAMLMVLGIFVISLLLTHYVSLSSMIAATFLPIIVIVLFDVIIDTYEPLTLEIFSVVAAILIFVTHRNNIKRLLNGTESKINFKKKAPQEKLKS